MFFSKVLAVAALNLLSFPAAFAQNDTPDTGTASSFTCNPGYPVSSSEQSIIFTNFLRKFYIEKDVTRAVQEHILLDAATRWLLIYGDSREAVLRSTGMPYRSLLRPTGPTPWSWSE